MMFVLDGHVHCHNEAKSQVILILFLTLLNWMLDLLWLTWCVCFYRAWCFYMDCWWLMCGFLRFWIWMFHLILLDFRFIFCPILFSLVLLLVWFDLILKHWILIQVWNTVFAWFSMVLICSLLFDFTLLGLQITLAVILAILSVVVALFPVFELLRRLNRY